MPALFQDLVSNNLHGRKTGQGLYIYQAGVKGGDREVNPKFTELIKNYAAEAKEQCVLFDISNRVDLSYMTYLE